MQMMLTGKPLRAKAARGMGVVDELVEATGNMRWAARRAVMKKRKPRKLAKTDQLTNMGPARKALAKVMRKKTAAKANPDHYMFRGEAETVGRLMVSDTAKNLRRIFYMTEKMKGLGKVDGLDFDVKRVHVVGAGVMGGDIAAWCVVQGFEDRDAKQALYKDLEPRMASHAVLATNTSAIPLEELSTSLNNPARLIGLHFFNPVAKMQLVEVVHAPNTDAQFIDKGSAFCTQINRFPLPTKSSPGFLVNRVLAPYLMEAMTMHLEGESKEMLDAAAVDFGMPMGPIELADVVGLDVCSKVADTLSSGNRYYFRHRLRTVLWWSDELSRKSR